MLVMPTGSAPKDLRQRPAFAAVGWTLPAASISLVVALLSFALAVAPSRDQRTTST